MNYYRIYLSAADDRHECTVTADDPAEALDNARSVAGVECFLTATAYDEDLFPRRMKTSTVSKPFLDYRGVWRVFVLGEDQAVELERVVVG